jgi:glycosyltransferase involved in cell wall biosynthesis
MWRPHKFSKVKWAQQTDMMNAGFWQAVDFFQVEAVVFQGSDLKSALESPFFLERRARGLQAVARLWRTDVQKQEFLDVAGGTQQILINLCIQNWNELEELPANLPVSWITKFIDVENPSDLTIKTNNPWEAPVFFESESKSVERGLHNSIQFVLAYHSYFISGNSIENICSLETWGERIQSPFYWQKENQFSYFANSEKPFFSVIIPTYNRRTHLIAALDRFLRQTKSNLKVEMIVVDDGGTDQTQDAIASWVDLQKPGFDLHFFRIPPRMSHEQFLNRVGPIRNFGAFAARSENLIFLDTDMIVPISFVEVIQDLPLDNTIYQPYRHNLDGQATDKILARGCNNEIFNAVEVGSSSRAWCEEQSKEGSNFAVWGASYCWIMSKEVFVRIGGFKNCYVTYGWEDTDFLIRANQMGIAPCPLDIPILHLFALDQQSEYQDSLVDRRIQLAPGSEILFLNTLSERAFRCFYYGLIRAFVFYRGLARYGSNLKQNNYLEQMSFSHFQALVKQDSTFVSIGSDFLDEDNINSDLKLIRFLRHRGVDLGSFLVVSDRVTLLPTALLSDDQMKAQSARSLITKEQGHYFDDLVNFGNITGWRFKSANLKRYEVSDSKVCLDLVNSRRETIENEFEFQTLIIKMENLAELPLEIKNLKPGTQVILLSTRNGEIQVGFQNGFKFHHSDAQSFY